MDMDEEARGQSIYIQRTSTESAWRRLAWRELMPPLIRVGSREAAGTRTVRQATSGMRR